MAEPHDKRPNPRRSDVRATVDANQPVALPSTAVVVEHDGTARLFNLAVKGELVIGRGGECDVDVDDDRVSRSHLRLRLRGTRLSAEDQGSRNGTLLNGRRLRGERLLRGGDELQVGPALIRAGGERPPEALVPEGELIDRLDEELHRAKTYRRSLGVVGLTFEGGTQAFLKVAPTLLGQLGRPDVAGEYAEGRILFLLPERGRAEAEAHAQLAAGAAAAQGITVQVRAAAFPVDGGGGDDLIDVVMRAGDPVVGKAEDGAELVAEAPETRAILEAARRAARSSATVLITGESGVGKEGIAREVHVHSARAAGPFVQLNCAALPDQLAESELFGHERGAFTGAHQTRIGLIESASGGTLLLDELGELSLSTQAKLLRVLEDRRVQRVGGARPIPVDVRFVAATNRDLAREVKAGRFREDLYFRVNTITLEVSPLRERPADLRAMVPYFVRLASRSAGIRVPGVAPAFVAALASYHWPGNVRELRNVIERAVILSDGDSLAPRHLPERFSVADSPSDPEGPMRRHLDEVERRAIAAALAETGGNRTHAARKLGVSRRALLYKLQKYGMTEPEG